MPRFVAIPAQAERRMGAVTATRINRNSIQPADIKAHIRAPNSPASDDGSFWRTQSVESNVRENSMYRRIWRSIEQTIFLTGSLTRESISLPVAARGEGSAGFVRVPLTKPDKTSHPLNSISSCGISKIHSFKPLLAAPWNFSQTLTNPDGSMRRGPGKSWRGTGRAQHPGTESAARNCECGMLLPGSGSGMQTPN